MRTENDLRNHYDHLADAASPHRVADRITTQLARSTPSHRGRSLVLALSTAAAVAAAAVAVPLALRSSPPPEPAAPPKDPTWQSWLTVPAPPGTDLVRQDLTKDYQIQRFQGTDLECIVIATRQAGFTAEKLQQDWGAVGRPRPVDVAGRPGHVLGLMAHELLVRPNDNKARSRVHPALRNKQKPTMVVWEPSDGLRAGVTCFRGPFGTEAGMNPADAQALRLARAISGKPTPLTLPFRLDKIPADLKVSSVVVSPVGPTHGYIVYFTDGDPRTGYQGIEDLLLSTGDIPGLGTDLQVSYSLKQTRWRDSTVPVDIPGALTWRRATSKALLDGKPGDVPWVVGHLGKGGVIQVAGLRSGTDEQDVKQVAANLTLADADKPSTWFPPPTR